MATYKELIAHNLSIAEICKHVGADSLAYLSLEGLMKATHGVEGATLNGNATATLSNGLGSFCAACFSGNYPIPIPKWLFEDDRDKTLFEANWG